MKILIINHFPLEGSGSGIYTLNLAKELSKMGHEVRVIYPEHRELVYEGFESKIIIFNNGASDRYDINYNFPCFTSHPRSNETYYNLSDMQIKEYVDTFIEVTKVEVESFKPDIIHAQHLWIAPYAAHLTGVPYVVTAHGTDLKGFIKDERYHKYALEGAKGAKLVITISNQVDEDTKALYGVEDNRRKILLNGYDNTLFKRLDLDRNKTLEKFGISKNYKYVVSFAGKLTHFKGVDVLLKAAKYYSKELDDQVLTVIAGNGELYEELNELKEKLNLNNVHFLGHVSQKQLVDLYNIADVNIVPSRSEPFGLVAIEALACGAPIVGTNQGGLPDFIIPEVGKLVEVDDDLALSDAIVEELTRENKEERKLVCAKYALDGFSWNKSIIEVERIYREIIEKQ